MAVKKKTDNKEVQVNPVEVVAPVEETEEVVEAVEEVVETEEPVEETEEIGTPVEVVPEAVEVPKQEVTVDAGSVNVDTSKKPDGKVKIRMRVDHRCTVGKEMYDLKAGKTYTVPNSVKLRLNKAGLLLPL